MDQRGTGRSTLLDCVAAQVDFTKSLDPLDVPDSSDLATFIFEFTNEANTFVYAYGYGTKVAESLMQVGPSKVTGYVLDSIAATLGAPRDKTAYYSDRDTNHGEVGNAFLALCATSSDCSKYLWRKACLTLFKIY
ncbi:unnamed protein product [Peronospora belbahrii]|uniref:Uncharacterized protein n=1 Tax=Peronospora belbahrii TaxID=622444 RepID=A0AAU9L0B8_9STRA|nr:unnamed protein product [Peronospora belbahrii]